MSSELRTLLVDCRIALRSRPDEAQLDALSKRLEQAIHEVEHATEPVAVERTKSSAIQVALAWQTVCRGLKLAEPDLYQELSGKVMGLLDQRELHEPTDELLHLQEEIERMRAEQGPMRARMDQFRGKAVESLSALSALREALSKAVPYLHSPADPQQRALAQIDELMSKGNQAVDQKGFGQGGSAPAAREGPVPSEALLNDVVAGERGFTDEQREWVVGEALGLTGWKYTPVELLDKGEPWLARCILLKKEPPEA